jgi:hypothetical protein
VVCCVDVDEVPVDEDVLFDVLFVVEPVVLLPVELPELLPVELPVDEPDPEPVTGGRTVIVAVFVVLTELPSDTAN